MKKIISFTLIELLIVIAIIAILASMLLPALKKARSVAYQTGCANNQKQLYLGLAQYEIDFNNLPTLSDMPFGCTPKYTASWCGFGTLYSNGYIKSGRVFFCPSPSNMAWTPTDKAGQGSYNGKVNSDNKYGWEYALANDTWIMNNYWLRWNQYTNNKEAAKGYLAQMRSRLSRNSPDRWLACDHWGTYTFSTDGLWRPHTGGVNVLFIDGHINFCKTTLTSETYPEPYKLIPELTGSWGKTNP